MEIISLSSGSHGNAYVVKSKSGTLLIECGLPEKKLKELLWDNDIMIRDIETCIISHGHQDHSKSAEMLANSGVNIWYPYTEDKDMNFSRRFKGVERKDRVNYLRPRKVAETEGYKLVGYELEHDGVTNFAYLVMDKQSKERLFYATDTMYIKYKPKKVNYWMIEINYEKELLEDSVKAGDMVRENMRRIIRSHMGLNTAIDFFKSNDLSHTKEIWILHYSDRNSRPDNLKKKIQQETGVETHLA